MEQFFIGRSAEQRIMLDLLNSNKAELLAIIGRRRVGKTHLIHKVYKDQLVFNMTGIQDAPLEEQLQNFTVKLTETAKMNIIGQPRSWFEAFQLLKHQLERSKSKKKKVIFFDEVPWIAAARSRFLESLAHFWNDWATHQNVLVVLCGSSSSWMIKKVVRNRGGLHNRITRLIHLSPFSLAETELFLTKKNIGLDRFDILRLYMCLGGIPHYLGKIEKGKSVDQNIHNICFSEHGSLRFEFQELYNSLFNQAEHHIAIIEALASKWKGLNRNEILAHSKIKDGGTFTKYLQELEQSDFIQVYQPFGKKKKDKLYRLIDPYSLFHLKFIKKHNTDGQSNFSYLASKPIYHAWAGYAFENICQIHIEQIKSALGIQSIQSKTSSYLFQGNADFDGIQIDLLIERADRIINLCEMKFMDTPFVVSKDYAKKLRQRRATFRAITKTKQNLHIVLLSPFGAKKNQYANELLSADINLEALFSKNQHA